MPAYKDAERKTWYVKYSQTTNGKRKQILKRGFATKRDALDWEAEQRGKEKPDSISFGEMAEKYYSFTTDSFINKHKQSKSRINRLF